MPDQPVVSIVLPLHQGERFIAQAIESVLSQKGAELDVIVVDDASTDRGADIARGYPVRVLSQSHGGVGAARNRAVRAARGELIGFIDQDDEWTPGRLAVQLAFLDSHPDVDGVMGHVKHLIEPGTQVAPWMLPTRADADGHFAAPMLGPVLARRRAFDRVGLFDESFAAGSDTDWICRVRQEAGDIRVVPDLVLLYRLHGRNASYDREMLKAEGMQILRNSVRRQRAAEGTTR